MGMSTTGMGMGMSAGPVGTMTWKISQSGAAFSGTVSFSGYNGGSPMMVTGTMNGKSGTFVMTMPSGSMPMAMAACSGQTTGTFDMDDLMVQMHGSYTGSNTCAGAFTNGQMTMARQ
jgi:hypothetical protein